jgi:hypothetical protein
MESLSKNKYLVLVVVVLCIAFYWFALRPAMVKAACAKPSEVSGFANVGRTADEVYQDCLNAHGI